MDYCDDSIVGSNCDTIFLKKLASNVTATTATISSISSMITITVIYRSQIRFSSVYHRIIVSMSVMDILSSVSSAFTTIPMPADQIYPFEGGMASGTTLTCEIQGFTQLVGMVGSYLYNCSLPLFYLCMIKFRMSDQKMRKCLEPMIHVLGIVVPVANASIYLYLDFFNPSPWETYCTLGDYPWACTSLDEFECIRGGNVRKELVDRLKFVVAFFVGIGFLNVLVCMGLILSTVFRIRNVRNKNTSKSEEVNNNTTIAVTAVTETQTRMHNLRGVLTRQALMYILSFIVIFSPTVFWLWIRSDVLDFLKIICFQLYGFFNFCIFMYHKVHNLRMWTHKPISIRRALFLVIIKPHDIPELRIAGLSNLQETEARASQQEAQPDVDNASKDMHLSYAEVSEEMSYALDFDNLMFSFSSSSHLDDDNENDEGLSKNLSEGSDQFISNCSPHDAPTLKACNW